MMAASMSPPRMCEKSARRTTMSMANTGSSDAITMETAMRPFTSRLLVNSTDSSCSVPGAPRRPRKRYHVAHVRESRHVRHGPLESQAETRMRHGAVAAQVAIPPVGARVEAEGEDALVEDG